MIFAIYADNLRVFTSAMPQRGLFKTYVRVHPEHQFIFYLHSRFKNDSTITDFFKALSDLPNWKLKVLRRPQLLSRILQLTGFASPTLPRGADVYISPDIETFGDSCRPTINFLADMTVFDDMEHTSLSSFDSKFRKQCITRMGKRSDLVLAVSKFTADRFRFYFPDSTRKVVVLYNGIDEQWFTQPKPPITQSDVPYWIWMGGGFTSRKNLERLFKAYKELLEVNNLKLPMMYVVGMDQLSIDKLKTFIGLLGVDQHVRIIPKMTTSELIKYVDLSSAVLFPSIYEGFGLPVIEAFARGKPVLVSRVTSLPEVSNGLGILCEPKDISSIREGLVKLLNNSGSEHAIFARKKWANEFSYAAAAAKFDEIINGLRA